MIIAQYGETTHDGNGCGDMPNGHGNGAGHSAVDMAGFEGEGQSAGGLNTRSGSGLIGVMYVETRTAPPRVTPEWAR